MKSVSFGLFILGMFAVIAAEAATRIISHDVSYRVTSGNQSYHVVPDPAPPDQPRQQLTLAESLERCDELIAALLEQALTAKHEPTFVRDRHVALRNGQSWVDYSQRSQSYAVAGAGARIQLNEFGHIRLMGLQFEDREFPPFAAKPRSTLEPIARAAVPHPITGPPTDTKMVIDPIGDGEPRLVYYTTYPVKRGERPDGWRIGVDAVSGDVVDARSVSR